MVTPDQTTVFRALGAASLFLTLGLLTSSAWGADPLKCKKCVGSGDMGKNAVGNANIKKNAVTTPKIKNGAVTVGKIGSNAVTGAKIKNGTVALRDLAADVTAVINPDLDPVAVTVNCTAGDTIQEAVDAARPGVTTTITLANDCTEDVVIAKDDIVISGDPTNGGAQGGTSDVIGSVTITGADRVVLDNVTVRDNTIGSFPVGVTVTGGASAEITDSIVSGHVTAGAVAGDAAGAGVFVTRNAYLTIDNTSVTNPLGGEEALILTDGATVRAFDSTFISNDGEAFTGAAIGLYRAASMRLDGNSVVTNTVVRTVPEEGLAIDVADTSNLRIQSGTNTITGNVLISSNSDADFRGVTLAGEIGIRGLSGMTLSGGASVTGDIDVDQMSLLTAHTPSTITGSVDCTSLSGVSLAIAPTGGTGICNTLP